jgi:hypothetical protein
MNATIDTSNYSNMSVNEFLSIFTQFSKEDQVKIAEKIALQTFSVRWKLLDKSLPDVTEISEEEIMNELRAVRYGE